MKEKELRLALVCYGGVSLAVYMHGITKEIQKLVRASSLLHQERDMNTRQKLSYAQLNKDRDRETDTESVYFDMLNTIGKDIDLRVIVDIVAGASAGGINGIMLARAITEDVSLDPLRKLWLENADVEKLLDPDAISGKWSKWYMRPVLWLMSRLRPDKLDEELGTDVAREVRMKLSRFVRSRWFKPPFSGIGFSKMLYEAIASLGKPDPRSRSLLPPGYPFDLFVTLTDFYGHAQTLEIHSPEKIQEREHRLVMRFHESGLDTTGHRSLGDLADLAFAARCTASFPGAFPPATLAEMDQTLRRLNQSWPGRTPFVRRAFGQLIANGSDPEAAAFVDGSVLNNKPFGQAISVLNTRPAYREVDRRIIYIEPNPMRSSSIGRGTTPGFFQSIRASLSDIPRNQPIRDDLEWLAEHTHKAGRLRLVLNNMSDDVDAAIESALPEANADETLDSSDLKRWRSKVHRLAAQSAGFTYAPYVELKVNRVLGELALHLSDTLRARPTMTALDHVAKTVSAWAAENNLLNLGKIISPDEYDPAPHWVTFLGSYDLSYRIRRLRFLIRRLNALYSEADTGVSHLTIDRAKKQLYAALAPFVRRLGTEWMDKKDHDTLASALRDSRSDRPQLLAIYRHALDLEKLDASVDHVIADILSREQSLHFRQTITRSYLGFAFYDVAMLPLLQSDGYDEFDGIKVDRVSPEDCTALRGGGAATTLKGLKFGNFGAFFSRGYRENDYLWGRLHGAERLIDIVLSSVDAGKFSDAQIRQWKNTAFQNIIRTERKHLKTILPLMDQLSAAMA